MKEERGMSLVIKSSLLYLLLPDRVFPIHSYTEICIHFSSLQYALPSLHILDFM
jgi:hypothetical protein